MKKLTANLFVSMLFLCTNAYATTYYFSSSGGDDSRSSTQAQSSSTPWKTLSKLNSIMSTLKAGDFVYFKRGDIFYGSITLSSKSGSSGSPITFGAYGSGAKPIITGLTTAGSWTSIGSGLYEAVLSGGLSSLNMVVMNGSFQPIGRYPKTTAPSAGYLILTSHSGTSSISSSQLSGVPSFVGGQIVIRKTHWILDKAAVTAQSSSSVSYSGSGYTPSDNFGFFFQNHINACTATGEWCYDPSTKKIKMYFGSSGTAGKVVQGATIDVLLSLSYANYITFDNLVFSGSNSKTFSISGSKYIVINACDFSFAGGDGMNVVSNCSNITLQNSTAAWTNNNFISAGGSTYWNIINNTISNTGSIGGMGNNGDGTYTGIYNLGDGSKAQYNTIKNTGYTSIFFRGNSISILNNFIDTFCNVKDDGAAIYSFTGSTATINTQRSVSNNIIVNGAGIPAGTTTPFSCAYGIYMDNNASNLTISGNSIANCGSAGIYLHGTHDLSITSNTIYNCVINAMYGQFYMKEESSELLRNHTVTDNKYISKASTQLVAFFLTPLNDINQFGTIDNNYYCRPVKESSTFTLYKSSGNLTTDLKGWQSFSGEDAHSKGSPKIIINVTDLRFEYNATTSNKVVNLGATYIDIKGTTYAGTITLAPYTSAVLIYQSGVIANQAPVANAGNPLSINLPVNLVQLNGSASSDVGGTIAAYSWSKISGPSSAIILTPSLVATTVNTLVQGVYQFELKVTDNQGATGKDTVQVTVNAVANSAPVANAGPDRDIIIPAFKKNSPITMSLTGTGTDNDGTIASYKWNKISGPVCTIDNPNQSQIMIRDLTYGVYVFELEVRDNQNAIGKDRVQIIIDSAASASKNKSSERRAEIADENSLNTRKESFVINPNPVTDNFTLELNNTHTGKMNIQIVNQLGAVIRSFSFDKSEQINTISLPASYLPTGVYFVHVQIDNWSSTKKILKL